MSCSKTINIAELVPNRLFKALGDPNRVALLAMLAECRRPCSVSELSTCCPIDMSTASRHLSTLRDAGILLAEKQGKQVFYAVNARPLAGIFRRLADALEACCPSEDDPQKECCDEQK